MNKVITIFIALTLPLILAFGLVKNNDHTNSNLNVSLVTFDGIEGNFYFFSDENQKAIQYEVGSHAAIENFNLRNHDYVGSYFIINADENEIASIKLIKNINMEYDRITSN